MIIRCIPLGVLTTQSGRAQLNSLTNIRHLTGHPVRCWKLSHWGQIDDVKIFNYALTSEQILTEYNNGAVRFSP